MTVSLSIAAVLSLAIGSAVLLAGRAVPEAGGPNAAVLEAGAAMAELSADLPYALSLSDRRNRSVTLLVPDRDGDGAPDTIRYAWGGQKGDPLTRQFNNGPAAVVSPGVRHFELAYDTRVEQRTEDVTATTVHGPFKFAAFSGWAGAAATPNATFALGSSNWASQYTTIAYAFPPETTKFSITRVGVTVAPQGATDGSTTDGRATFSVEIHKVLTVGSPQPASGRVGSAVAVVDARLPLAPTGPNYEVQFGDVSFSPATKEVTIVVKGTSNAAIKYCNWSGAAKDNYVLLTTTNGGGAYAPTQANQQSQNDMPFYVWGTYTTTSTAPATVDHHFLRAVRVSIESNDDATAHVETVLRVLNEPEV
jgi:hypothetical protein